MKRSTGTTESISEQETQGEGLKINDIRAIAVAQCKMSLTEYYDSEIEVVLSIIDSFYTFENNKERQEWER